MAYVVDGFVRRIRGVDPKGTWVPGGNRWEIPVTAALTPSGIAEQFPTPGFTLDDPMPGARGKMRGHIAL
ncbi:hypothetical protein ACIRPX_04760 [Streptomyces sp. NPDC101225]|uniref:hypothetical protein n=1 Tax=Streptomyces sp. NPDC101225 TaxID=3366135 RepID=UPI003817A7E8